ncbi:hypothetical protein BDV38DRAFT_294154 [Aspergillus pseudotamarii]|uniref:Fungal-specific transcription factor domain-containing protein n=1 Tax=Aspergillus pseudotamarii TaxID=132259 RepID=A0A5N6SQK0_ASPPS|nr:uncharacterized protein BDV38DRAFT_294154 [Aspergillus pseudotamarii]KAE8136109.1 hypothetical protein BDV38DRAFT_294154 [Aspergillus pseudotamarii]
MASSSPVKNYKIGKPESYSCNICSSQFSRGDHLTRHYRSHTKQRPFVCPVCCKGFARRDLMTRHKAKHVHGTQSSATESSTDGFRYRVSQACKRCAAAKLKCTDEKPCPRCIKKSVPCETSQSCRTGAEEPGHHAPDNDKDTADTLWTMASFFDMGDQATEPASTGDLTGVQYMDFSFLEEMNTANETNISAPELPSNTHPSIMPISSQAYITSSVARAWVPLSTENGSMERANLALAGDIHEPPTKGNLEHVSLQLIAPAARDRILNMVFTAYPEKTGQIVEGFPSAEILSKLVYRYVSQRKVKRVDDFIHLPTFDWKSRRPELLAAMIAMGSIDGPSAAVRKFGYALQATVRRATIQRYEEDHAKMRDMDLAQAYMIQQYIGFFSGISRKIGLAESCSMITSTIISQARMLLQGPERTVEAVLATDSIEQLDHIWRRWCQQESIRRLIYYSYSLDSQVSITRNLNPILPYTDMDSSLPCPDALWHADSPASWRQELLEKTATQPTSLRDLLQSPRLLKTCAHCLDSPFVHLVYVSGLWSIIQEYRRLSCIASSSSAWNNLVLMSRHSELKAMLERFGKESTAVRRKSPEVDLLYSLVSMHLHVSFKDLQPMGSSGKGEICNHEDPAARQYALAWRKDAGSWFTIWFAGQVVRAAKAFRPETLCDVYSIGLLQATVVLWVYGNLSDGQIAPSRGPPIIELNETDPAGLENYLCYGEGQPGLNVWSRGFVPLSNSRSIVEAIQGIIQRNWQHASFPSGTDEVYQVLSDLQTCSSIQG